MSRWWDEVRQEAAERGELAELDAMLEEEQANLAAATEQWCSEGCCIEWVSPEGESLGGYGPVGCKCQDDDDA